ncbi:GNAT family N-acetyltransferase [Micromonospora globbae]|uniref:GNAT family N-acetyltransferase n=1 Tax=Micromonospora globbae TaxID=1894969 RepID=A0A420F299_9ACTN|nr:GNAT family N-acetyltransferase [Micromonospora globbae]RKF27070.1 GNAT family N-acetyltransferase [Micromonospora globbae]WTF87714.1 GNAT family N-acetyltransferase [Micromonospora globbae]
MVTIRREEPDDAEAVARVHVHGWQAGYAGIMPDEVLRRLNVAAWAQRRRDVGTADPEHPFTTLLAESGDEGVVGFTSFGPYRVDQDRDTLDPAWGEVLALFVEPGHWGDGTATALLRAARAGLAGRGFTAFRAWVLEENHRARRFTVRAGLSPDGERSTYPVPLTGGRPPVRLVELRYAGRLDG